MKVSPKYLMIPFSFISILMFINLSSGNVRAELAGLWLFEEGKGDIAEDSSGKGHDGNLMGCEWDNGKYGKGLRFNAGNFFEVPDHEDFKFGDKITIALWANIENLPLDHVGIPGKGHDLPVGSFVFHPTKVGPDSYELRFYISVGAAWPMVKSGDTIDFGDWHHLAGTYDGSKMKVYVDGEIAGTFDQKGKINDTEDAPLKFANDFGGRQLVGILDEIRIYNNPLTEDEIKKTLDPFSLSLEDTDKLAISWGKVKCPSFCH